MNFEEFMNFIKEHLLDKYALVKDNAVIDKEKREKLPDVGENSQVVIDKVYKNNGLILNSLSIFFDNTDISPNIYLEPFFNSYMSGRSMDFILMDIIHCYIENFNDLVNEGINLSDYDKIKDNIVIRVINYEKNKELLDNCPHTRYLDIAVTYRYIVTDYQEGMASILITNKEFIPWGIELTKLHENAVECTRMRYPSVYMQITELVSGYFDTKMEELPEEAAEEIKSIDLENAVVKLYVLTNTQKAFGAGCILYSNLLKSISDEWGSNMYILPSSVHETMLVPDAEDVEPEFLKGLLEGANKASVGYIDLLSDNIYYYNRESDKTEIYEVEEETKA